MADSYFEVLREGQTPKRNLIRINGRDPTFKIEMDRIAAQLVTPMTSVLKDLMEVASAIFLADTTVRRGGDTRPDFGAKWQRRLVFRLLVRNLDLWSRVDVLDALIEAVEFLTGDRVQFDFAQREIDGPADEYLPFDTKPEVFAADEVILFSGGLDSFAGALEALTTRHGNVILVTHRSAQKAIPRQETLGKFLKDRFGRRVLHLHIKATRSRKTSSDSTQRSRSLLFAALGHVVARMADAKRISFYENGVVSHNLPIGPQVVGTMASRTTHPLSLRMLQKFLDLVGEPRIPIANSFEWLTKQEVVEKIRDLDGCAAIRESVSCTTSRNESRETHHCGSCSQCLDRRFAIVAAGLDAHERASDYKIDVLTGARDKELSRTMAIEWTRHASRFADMDIMAFSMRFASDLARLVMAYPNHEPTAIVEQALDMQKRHAATVHRVIQMAIETHAALLARARLPETSLLSMYLNKVTGAWPRVEDALTLHLPPESGKDLEEPAPAPAESIFPLRVAFYGSPPDFVVEVERLGCVRHGPAGVVHDLKPQFEADLAAHLAPENHHYVPARVLARTRRHVSTNTVAQHVLRCRAQLAEFYFAIEQHPPERDLLIENRRKLGYRLDPTMRIVDQSQLRLREKP